MTEAVFKKGLKEFKEDLSTRLARSQLSETTQGATEEAVETLAKEIGEKMDNAIADGKMTAFFNDFISDTSNLGKKSLLSGSRIDILADALKRSRNTALTTTLEKTSKEIAEEFGEEAGEKLLKDGWVKRITGYDSKIRAAISLGHNTIEGITQWASCRNDNLMLDVMDTFLNCQLVFELGYKSIMRPYTFYVGKTGSTSITYTQQGEEMDVNKLYAVSGDDLCFAREAIAYEMDDYAPINFDIVDGTITFKKNKGLYDTVCDESSEYYPIGIPEIAEYVSQACKVGLGENNVLLPRIRVYATPSKIITKEGTTICEERVERNEEGNIKDSFKIMCFNLTELTDGNGNACNIAENDFDITVDYNRDLNAKTWDEGWDAGDISGNSYFYPEAPQFEFRFSVDSPITGIFRDIGVLNYGEDLFAADLDFFEDIFNSAISFLGNPDKEYYFPSRYDYYILEAKMSGGKIVVDIIPDPETGKLINNVLGANYNGVYTEENRI